MRTDKHIAFELRKQGKTYGEIRAELGIAKSTLCDWFRDVPWSRHVKKSNTESHITRSTEHMKKLNDGRKKWLTDWYEQISAEAIVTFKKHSKEPLFVAGLMLYAGEGEKNDMASIKMANCDFELHKIFMRFMLQYLAVENQKIKCSVLAYPDLDLESCLAKWSFELGIPRENFYKTQVIQGKHKTRRLQFGVGTIILVGSKYKRTLLKWIDLYKKSAIDAAMV